MAKVNYKLRLEKLLTNELSSSNDKKQVTSAYKSLMEILQVPQLGKHLHGYHEILFQCLSQIILTPCHRYFDDEELNALLQSASNARVLTMSQNQIIDGWLQNIDERTFEKPDEDDDDDDDQYEDTSDIESEDEEEEVVVPKSEKNIKSNRGEGNQPGKKEPFRHDVKTVSFKQEVSVSPQPAFNRRDKPVAHPHENRMEDEPSARGNRRRRGKENKSDKASPFDNKYGVDLRLYDCYLCGEYGHVQYDCPKKKDQQPKPTPRDNKDKDKTKKPRHRRRSFSPTATNQTTNQDLYNLASKLLTGSQTTAERNETINTFLSDLDTLEKQHGENLTKIFLEKETLFYSLFCHIAQHDFLFTTDQYSQLYHFKHLLLPKQHQLINADRSMFARQRILTPLDIITKHIQTTKQIQQTIFNDFEEYIIRSTSPIPVVLFDLVQYLLKSNIHIDEDHLKNFTEKILFDLKRNLFSNEQLTELQSYLSIRIKRFERTQAKQIWKERINLFKTNQLPTDLTPWLNEFDQILQSNTDETDEELSNDVVHHAMWYFAVLILTSSGHLNPQQYEHVLNVAIQSRLFSKKQKYYFQVYLQEGHAPITLEELKEIQSQLEKNDEKQTAYQRIRTVLDRTKPSELENLTDILPIIDNHILSRLISLVETICSDSEQFSHDQCKELLDQFLDHSSIVRPIPIVEQNRLKSFYSRPMSLNELKKFCSSSSLDMKIFFDLLKNETMVKNDEVFDYLTEFIGNIFRNRRKYSNELCDELKSLIDKRIFQKQRFRILNEIYQEFRVKRKDCPPIDPTILNQLFTRILAADQQIKAIGEFFTILEDLSSSMDFDQITVELEINRCLLSSIILVIIEIKSSNIDKELKNLFDKQKEFFSQLLTEQQFQLIDSHLISDRPVTTQSKSTTWKIKDTDESPIAHRELFKCLESNDPSMNALVVEQLRAYLLDEQLPSNILLPKFIQALQKIVRNREKFSQVSLEEWEQLIGINRGKIFSNDAQCDELLLNILLIRLNMPNETLKSIERLTQSRKMMERNEGVEKLLTLLRNTQMENKSNPINHLPTVSNPLYQLITSVVFDETYPDSQIRKWLSIAKRSWLLNSEHRQKLNI